MRWMVVISPSLVVGCLAPVPPETAASADLPARITAAQEVHPHPSGVVAASIGLGELQHTSTGSGVNFDGDADAQLVRFQFEGGGIVGGGVMLEATLVDDDLDRNRIAGGAEAGAADIYPHLTIRPTGGERFRIPIRIGPYVQSQVIDPNSAAGEFIYVNAGGRVGVEPEVDVVLTDRVRLAVFGGVSFGAGVALIEIDSGSDTEEFDTEASTFGIEAGVRLTLAKFLFSVAYVHRETTYDRSDPGSLGGNAVSVFGNAVNETDFEFDGVMFTAGFRW